MLFLVVQEHTPENCPQREGKPPHVLFERVPEVTVRYAVADVPGHRLTFLLETDSYDALHLFLEPGRTSCTTNISPVTEI